jgi:hypothetical protein
MATSNVIKLVGIETDPHKLARTFDDSMVVDQVRTFTKRCAHALRELEAWKLENGYCVLGMTCVRKHIKGKRGCAHHLTLRKSGTRVFKRDNFVSEYNILQKFTREREKALREQEAAVKSNKRVQQRRRRAA